MMVVFWEGSSEAQRQSQPALAVAATRPFDHVDACPALAPSQVLDSVGRQNAKAPHERARPLLCFNLDPVGHRCRKWNSALGYDP